MARNEEKQLARLNRLYLQQQKEEELKKRPPRPKLETLSSVDDVKKWLPSIMRDIDFYVKQMEVPCYPKTHIQEFECRIDHLRGEYKAFIRKLRQLEPDLKTTPWTDRPYAVKRKKIEACLTYKEYENDTIILEGQSGSKDTDTNDIIKVQKFIPLATPVLNNDNSYQHCYGFDKPKVPCIDEVMIHNHDEPLHFDFGKRSVDCVKQNTNMRSIPRCAGHVDGVQLEFVPRVNCTDESCACAKKLFCFHAD